MNRQAIGESARRSTWVIADIMLVDRAIARRAHQVTTCEQAHQKQSGGSMDTKRVPVHLRRALLALLAAALFTSVACAADPVSENPSAQAEEFERQAADLRANAEKHEKMAKMHRASAGPAKMKHDSIARHCDRIAENLRRAAKESDELAATYRDLAKSP
jgi:hypothetical protein